jgi:hypothetical protein
MAPEGTPQNVYLMKEGTEQYVATKMRILYYILTKINKFTLVPNAMEAY